MQSNNIVTVLESKGKYHFCKYESGLYTVDRSTKNTGTTVFASFNRLEVEMYFKKNIK